MSARLTLIIPFLLVAGLIAIFVIARPFDRMSQGTPPVEDLNIEFVKIDADGFHVSVRAAGSQPIAVAQVQVDSAYRTFTQTPPGPISHLGSAEFFIPYVWVKGDTYHLLFVTRAGLTFAHTIETAVATPSHDATNLMTLALIGLFVGFVPILIGFGFYPGLASFGEQGRNFAMALTIGLLVFLFIDTMEEGLDIAATALSSLKATGAVWLGALVTLLMLLAVGRRSGKPPEGVALALFIAIGIGIHNLGEGLAIGASFAVGEVALASFLVLGFAIHNVTEGIAILAPVRRENVSPLLLLGLALIAGAPAALGTIVGTFAVSPFWTALAFGVGAGAILQVIIEVGAAMQRAASSATPIWFTRAGISGFLGGIVVMFATAFLIQG
jgi:zinc transporter, ZIP family